MELTNQKVTVLRNLAKSEGIKGYSSMNKAQLIDALTAYYNAVAYEEQQMAYNNSYFSSEPEVIEDNRANDESDIILNEEVNIEVNTVPTNATVKMFDVERYAKFVPDKKFIGQSKSANQLNLVKSLENNFKVSIKTDDCDFYGLSVKLKNVYNAILSGKVQYRSQAEIEARVKVYVPVENNKATKSQLDTISRLEKELGITVTTVISSKQVASQVIQSLLNQKRQLAQKEVAVTSTSLEQKLANTTFRTKFSSMLKRIFNA